MEGGERSTFVAVAPRSRWCASSVTKTRRSPRRAHRIAYLSGELAVLDVDGGEYRASFLDRRGVYVDLSRVGWRIPRTRWFSRGRVRGTLATRGAAGRLRDGELLTRDPMEARIELVAEVLLLAGVAVRERPRPA